jgi:hypothetical protein
LRDSRDNRKGMVTMRGMRNILQEEKTREISSTSIG